MATAVLRAFELYQKARIQFVQTVAELAKSDEREKIGGKRDEIIDALDSAGALVLLRPLLLDPVPSIAQTACIAIGRLAMSRVDIAESIVKLDILPNIIYSLGDQNRFYKKYSAFVLRSVAKHNSALATAIIENDGLQALAKIVEEFDPSVREAGCWALSYIAKHSPKLANDVMEAVSITRIVICLQEPEIGLKRIAVNLLLEIARHSQDLAYKVCHKDATTPAFLGQLLEHDDTLLKRQVLACLAHIAFHSHELSSHLLGTIQTTRVLQLLKDPDALVRMKAAELMQNLVKHAADAAKAVLHNNGVKSLVEFVYENKGAVREPGIWALSYIAGWNENLAMSVISQKGITALKDALLNESEKKIQARAAECLGTIGKQSPDHSKAMTDAGILGELLRIINIEEANSKTQKNMKALKMGADIGQEILLKEAKKAMKKIISQCNTVFPLESLLVDNCPETIVRAALKQLEQALQNDRGAKKGFVERGGLRKVLIKGREMSKDQTITTAVSNICKNNFDERLVNFYTPNYVEEVLIKRVENVSDM